MTLTAPISSTTLGPEKVVCVLGMHRSGTSMVTRLAQAAGLDLGPGDQLMEPHAMDNPTGYWENVHVVELNDRLLEIHGGAWDDPPVLRADWEYAPSLEPLRLQARQIISGLGGEGAVVGWKDPRMSLVLPFWKTVVPIHSTIIVHRHPFQVAASLQARDGMDTERAADLWSRHLVGAWCAHPNRALVSYEYALAEPVETVMNLAGFLGVATPESIADEVCDYAMPGLNRNASAQPEIGPNMTLALALHALIETQAFATIDAMFDGLSRVWESGRDSI